MNHRINPAINRSENPKRYEKETNHHIMPGSRASNIVNEAQIMLFATFHDSFHRVFGNGTPAEQILKLLSINWPVHTEAFKREIEDVLRDDNFVYRKWLWTPKK